MKKTGLIALLAVMGVTIYGVLTAGGGGGGPLDTDVPWSAPSEVKKAISGLESDDPDARAMACGEIVMEGGEGYEAAVPFLVRILNDDRNVPMDDAWNMTPAEYARDALVAIGKPAVDALVATPQLKDETIRLRSVLVLVNLAYYKSLTTQEVINHLETFVENDPSDQVQAKAEAAIQCLKKGGDVDNLFSNRFRTEVG